MPFPVKWKLVGRRLDRASKSGRTSWCEADNGVGADDVPIPTPLRGQFEEEVLLRIVEVLPPILIARHVFVDGDFDRAKVDTIVLDMSDA
jgi:hypothetical protein